MRHGPALAPVNTMLARKYMIRHLVSVAVLLVITAIPAATQTTFNSAEIAKKVSPAVVTIIVHSESGQVTGSGFLISPDGKIITSLHVVRSTGRGSVELANGDIFDSFTVRAIDERRDLAILQIPGFDLPVAELGNSNEVPPGEPVLFVGSPRGLQGTITVGVISAIRELPEGFKVIQTGAAANPGNSGGPLLNGRGQVVGVLGFKLTDSAGLNFAVPINYARGMLNNLSESLSLAVVGKPPGNGSAPGRVIQRLSDLKTLAVASLGTT